MQFSFRASERDWWEILDAVLSPGDMLIYPDMWYRTEEIAPFSELSEEVKQTVKTERRVFIQPNCSEREPLRPRLQKSGPRSGWWSILPPDSGKALDLTLPACYEEEGKLYLGVGQLFVASSFPVNLDNPVYDDWQSRPEWLTAYYSETCKRIQTCLQVCSISQQPVGRDAAQLLNTGRAQLPPHEPRGS